MYSTYLYLCIYKIRTTIPIYRRFSKQQLHAFLFLFFSFSRCVLYVLVCVCECANVHIYLHAFFYICAWNVYIYICIYIVFSSMYVWLSVRWCACGKVRRIKEQSKAENQKSIAVLCCAVSVIVYEYIEKSTAARCQTDANVYMCVNVFATMKSKFACIESVSCFLLLLLLRLVLALNIVQCESVNAVELL